MKSLTSFAILGAFCCFAGSAAASGIAVRMGPPSVGSGGPNPVALPPGPADLAFTYLTDKGTEFNLSIISLSVAWRTQMKAGFYMSLGGGLAIGTNGAGLGPYASFGYEGNCAWYVCFTSEYQQALGFGSGSPVMPSALRIGVIRWF